MKYPLFFDSIEHIVLQDGLSATLGSSQEGVIDISYLEIVKMAGHSCAVISGAYLMTLIGLKELYQEELPLRGEIRVEIREHLGDGNTGVFGQVYSNITGATTNTGFGGLGGNFNRRNLMFYGVKMEGNVRFTRLDTNQSVELGYNPASVVAPGDIMQSAFGPNATPEERKSFPTRWQEMVKTIFDNSDKVVRVI
ncbi:MAG: hypothetical protein DRI84_06670 [Bacteroidetes bacterium]|nr:MAG: hypothetical protein DRI84_06670 [Bacteroidota bacterium]